MKAAVLYQFDESLQKSAWLAYEDVADPVIEKPTDVIVRIGGAGVCRTDLHLIQGLWRRSMRIELPLILGHENAGWVEEIGPSVQSVRIGDPVIVHPLAGRDGHPFHRSHTHPGPELEGYPGFTRHGGFAEYMLTDERMLLRLPPHISPMDAAPLADAGLTSYSVARKALKKLSPGHYILVLGAGGVGHVCIQLLRVLSTAEIIVVEKSAAALGLAREAGAHYTFVAEGRYTEKIMALTGGRGVETVIDFVGEDSTIAWGLSVTRRGGYYYLVGYGGQLTISAFDLILSEKSIFGVFCGGLSELEDLLTLVDRGLVAVTTREYPLNAANEALHDLRVGRNSGRLVLIP
ncbi:MAG: NAD(P)-dependent alcohol dehydrogenase [Thermodesulfobacteriota bacterium]